jgi:polysaccharide deacetylase family protein (PEP-CTERM system associated)
VKATSNPGPAGPPTGIPAREGISPVRHAFTVDLEDWYQGIPVAAGVRESAERRLHVGTNRLLDLMARHSVRGTFFILGPIAREHPELVRRIAAAGHEIGSHGTSHDLIYEMTPDRFRRETLDSMQALEDLTGMPVQAYRAAYFSITRRSFWALDILAELGFRYDSSIFPVANWRYGIPGFSRRPIRVETPSGPILEFPITTRRIFGRTIPTAGGAYFRIYPWFLTRDNMEAAEARGEAVVFYIHPWELDPEHPRVPFPWKARITHYVGLKRTAPRLERLMSRFTFTTLGDVLDDELARPGSPILQS